LGWRRLRRYVNRPRVGDFEVATGGGIWVAVRAPGAQEARVYRCRARDIHPVAATQPLQPESVSAIYDRHRYDAEARVWLQKWADFLEALTANRVVSLRVA